MKVQPVIDRALRDPIFAAELGAKAGRASRASDDVRPVEGDAWEDLLQEFADGPDELARLMNVRNSQEEGTTTATTGTTTTTITTTTTLFCATTTTTTTTTVTTTTTTLVVEEA